MGKLILRGRHMGKLILQGQILVTGAAGGLGRELIKYLLRCVGVHVLAVDRSLKLLGRLRDVLEKEGFGQLAHRLHLLPCDLLQPSELEKVLLPALSGNTALTGVINNASITYMGSTELSRNQVFQQIHQINYLASTQIMLAALESFIQHQIGERRNLFVLNIASLACFFPCPYQSAYVSSKIALRHFTRSLAAERRYRGIVISLAYPGSIDTPMLQNTSLRSHVKNQSLFRTPADTAAVILQGLRNRKSHIMTFPTEIMSVLGLSLFRPVVEPIMQRQLEGLYYRAVLESQERLPDGPDEGE